MFEGFTYLAPWRVVASVLLNDALDQVPLCQELPVWLPPLLGALKLGLFDTARLY